MKKDINNILSEKTFSFLIYKKKDVFIGICRETGYVEEESSEEEVLKRLLNGTKAICESVKKNPELLPSIDLKPPLKYRFLFYWIPFYFSLKNLFKTNKVETFDLRTIELCPQA